MWKAAVVLFFCYVASAYTSDICEDFSDFILNRDECFQDLDDKRNITQAVQAWGFEAEEHNLITEDGYQILVERVYKTVTRKNPILVGHGIMMNAGGFTIQKNKSLAYVLAEAGYDVWLISFRGTTYSLGNNKLTSEKYPYWNYSFHEMGVYDLKVAINRVWNVTHQKAVYVGYSMGNHAGFIYGSRFPEDAANKLTSIVALSPVAYYIHQKSFARFLIPFMPLLMAIDQHVFNGHFFEIIPKLAPLCSIGILPLYFCHGLTGLVFGDDYAQIDLETYPTFFRKAPDTICMKNLNHMFQIVMSNKFQQYDYGRKLNIEYYNQPTPPLYNLTNIPVPVSLWLGPNDWIATIETSERINREIQSQNKCKINLIPYHKWMHLDFLCAKDVKTLFYDSFLPEIEKLASGTCTK